MFCFYFVWYHQESNRGHKDFQSFALPTELWHHFFLSILSLNKYVPRTGLEPVQSQ